MILNQRQFYFIFKNNNHLFVSDLKDVAPNFKFNSIKNPILNPTVLALKSNPLCIVLYQRSSQREHYQS